VAAVVVVAARRDSSRLRMAAARTSGMSVSNLDRSGCRMRQIDRKDKYVGIGKHVSRTQM
jgi:hypothetical protein